MMTIFKEINQFFTDPKILGKILDWGIAWGSLLGVIALLVALLVLKERKAIISSLLLLAAAALLIWPADVCRRRPAATDVDRAVALRQIQKARDASTWIFYAQGAIASLAALTLSSGSTTGKFLLGLAILGGLVVFGFGVWLQVKELQILSPALKLAIKG